MCHQVNERHQLQCSACNYVFGQPVDETRAQLREQLSSARTQLIGLAIVDVLFLGLLVVMALAGVVIFWIFGCVLLAGANIRVIRKMQISRDSLRSLDRQFPALPKARLVSAPAAKHDDGETERK
jgi:hypothetical protein